MSMYNIIRGSNNLSVMLFETIGLENKNPQTEEEKELCDVRFDRYQGTTVMENFNIIRS